MKIKIGPNEKITHINLKKKAVELLRNRGDIINIETEYKVINLGGRIRYVDVMGEKNNGGNVYIEVKSNSNVSSALNQLYMINNKKEEDEFVIIYKKRGIGFFKSLWRDKLIEWQKFVNKIDIYTFSKEYELKKVDVVYKNGDELWVDGIREI